MRKRQQEITLDHPATYQIRVPGVLDAQWDAGAGDDAGVPVLESEDPPVMVITATLDQAALHGLLRRLYALGIPIISVNQVIS
ncbi:MAG: hypothetical protein R2873_14065 [Caldilineaceae bacterium]|nr:hypothetical protein [Caldilineaceae bacterium]